MDYEYFKPKVKELISFYCGTEGNEAGGNLHIVLADGNVDGGDIYFCMQECEKKNDLFGFFLCKILFEFTPEEMETMWQSRWY